MNIFVASQASVVLDDLITQLPKQPKEYHVGFVTTASNLYDDPWWMAADKKKLTELGFQLTDIDIAGTTPGGIKELFAPINLIFVAGGNTIYLLEQAQESGFDAFVREAVSTDVIYIGSSAGSVILAPDIAPSTLFDERAESQLKSTKALGLINFVPLPHYGAGMNDDLNEQALTTYAHWTYPLMPLADTQYVHMHDGQYTTIDTAKP